MVFKRHMMDEGSDWNPHFDLPNLSEFHTTLWLNHNKQPYQVWLQNVIIQEISNMGQKKEKTLSLDFIFHCDHDLAC